jgi:hypothetical protein
VWQTKAGTIAPRIDYPQSRGNVWHEHCRRGHGLSHREHCADVIAAFEAAIARVHNEPGVELYALHEGRDRLVMIEKYAQVLEPHPAGDAKKCAL